MHKVLFTWRGVDVHSYDVALYLGALLGLIAGDVMANVAGLRSEWVLSAMLVLLVVGLVGARGLHVLLHRPFYRRRPDLIWHRSGGGAAHLGGLASMLLVSPLLLSALAIPVGRFWDVATVPLLIGLIFGKLGCTLNGCCAGQPSHAWFALPLPDHQGVRRRRVPTQLLEICLAVAILAGVALFWNLNPFPGALFLLSLTAYGFGRAILQPTRITQDMIGAANAQQLLAACLGAGALLTLFIGLIGANGGP